MAKRMWRTTGPLAETVGHRGFFDVPYGTDSEKQKFDLWLPETGEGPFPLVVSIHGGGFIACDKRSSEMIGPMLPGLERGYAVAGVNYRLADECCFPGPVRDVKRCIRYLRAHAEELHIDPDRMVLWGGSAGGYLALMGALCEGEALFDDSADPNGAVSARVAGCVAWYPLVDARAAEHELKINSIINRYVSGPAADVSGEYSPAEPVLEEDQFPFYELPGSVKDRLLGPYDTPELGPLADAKTYIRRGMPPFFLQHGSRDEIVPMQQSIDFALAAEAAVGKGWGSIEIIPGAIHSSVLLETEENLGKVFAFIDRVTK